MSSLAEITAGNFPDKTQIKIAEGITTFPRELFALSETLEILDLSGNRLSALPDDFDRFQKLRILFLSDNQFCTFPAVLSRCSELTMIGFKANQISDIPEGAFPPKLRWLILTNNRIAKLPTSIGTNLQLQKVMLAGNRLQELPAEMARCDRIELLRLSANRLTALPEWLTRLPRLSWLAFSGNPCSQAAGLEQALQQVHWDELQLLFPLGEGASGLITQARWLGRGDIALKEFKDDVTSDGLPADEMLAAMAAGQHKNLVGIVGELVGHPDAKRGLLLTLIAEEFANLAAPPSLSSCTRDVYAEAQSFSLSALLNIADGIASAACHLHQRNLMHGDLYAHNILVNRSADCLLGDFGAATRYDTLPATTAQLLERIEVRAFGCLLEELLQRLDSAAVARYPSLVTQLERLQQRCLDSSVARRPGFSQVHADIQAIGVGRVSCPSRPR